MAGFFFASDIQLYLADAAAPFSYYFFGIGNAVHDIKGIKECLLSFGKYAENAAPDVLVTLIQAFVEQIYITDEHDKHYCHTFFEGCSKEVYIEYTR